MYIPEPIITKTGDLFSVQCAVCDSITYANTKKKLEMEINNNHWIIDSVLNRAICPICKKHELHEILQSIMQALSRPEPWMTIKDIAKISNLHGGHLHGTYRLSNSYDIESRAHVDDTNRFICSMRIISPLKEIKMICVAGENNKWYIKNITYNCNNNDQINSYDVCDILYIAIKNSGI